MVARLPEREAIIPLRILRSLANQAAADPESADRMQLSGNRLDNSQKTYCGFIGLAMLCALASRTLHHLSISFSNLFLQSLFSFLFSSGIRAFKVSLLPPCRFTSTGYLIPSILPSISICTPLACP